MNELRVGLLSGSNYMEVNMTVDIDLWVTATILRELRNNGLITQKEAEKILSRVAKLTGATLIISV